MSNWYLVEIEALIQGIVLGESGKDAEAEVRLWWQKSGLELLETTRVELVGEIEEWSEDL